MKKPLANKVPAAQKQASSPAAPVKKEMPADSSKNLQCTSEKKPGNGEAAKVPESQKQASPAPAQKMTPETQRTSKSQKPDQTTGTKLNSITSAPQQESGGLFGFGSTKTGAAKQEDSVTGKMFGFSSSIFSSASTLMASAVHDEPKTTPPVSPKMQPSMKPSSAGIAEQDKKQDQPQHAKTHPAGQAKVDRVPSETPKAPGKSTCPLCQDVLNMGTKDPPNYKTCTECKSTVCNQCGFNPMPNVKEVGKNPLN